MRANDIYSALIRANNTEICTFLIIMISLKKELMRNDQEMIEKGWEI